VQSNALRFRRKPLRVTLVGNALAALAAVAFLLTSTLPARPADLPAPEFSPTGTVKDIAQVTARFAATMIALGDPRAPSPFAIDCPEPGSERWIDSRTWAYDFGEPLPGGVRCRFTLLDGLAALDGTPIAGGAVFELSTGGPAIVTSTPSEESRIEEAQAFVLRLDAEAVPASIEEYAWFGVDGIGEKVGVRLLAGDEREAILATLPVASRKGPIAILQGRQTFPAKAKVRLVWGKGIAATSGIARTEDQVLDFEVRPAFLAELACAQERPRAPCVPLRPIRVRFSSPVAWEQVRAASLVGEKARFAPEPPDSTDGWVSELVFRGPFAASSSLDLELPGELRDDAGRTLANADRFPLRVEIGPDPPLAKFAARFGILESKVEPALPITVRNLGRAAGADAASVEATLPAKVLRLDTARAHEIVPWLSRVALAHRARSIFAGAPGTPAPRSLAVPIPGEPGETEVLGIPLPEPGLYVVEVASRPLGEALLGKPEPMYVSAAALVTNLAVHLKWGRQSSLVWVTSLDRGEPVGDASVRVHDCTGRVLWQGPTDAQGLARIDALPGRSEVPSCSYADEKPDPFRDWRGNQPLSGLGDGLFVTAELGGDLGFVFSSWNDGIEAWRFGIFEGGYSGGTITAHTILARSLLRAGQPVHMKHVLRRETDDGFGLVPPEDRPTRVTLRHQGTGTSVDFPLDWADDGTAETVWTIPPSAKLGTYDVTLVRPEPEAAPSPTPGATSAGAPSVYRPQRFEETWESATFRVAEFRVPLLQAAVKLPPEAQVRATRVPVDMSVRYLAGGGAGEMPIVLRSTIRDLSIQPPKELESFAFGNGAVEVGIERQRPYSDSSQESTSSVHRSEKIVLDAQGTARAWIEDLPPPTTPKELGAEIEFRDPNGEIQTSSSSVPLWPAAWVPGIRIDDWAGTGSDLSVHVAVIDPSGKPVADAAVQVTAFSQKYFSNRTRVVGGFYAYEYVTETERLHALCSGRTDAEGRLSCRRRPPGTGQLVLEATVRDARGAASSTHGSVWIEGSSDVWFEASDADRMELVPERRRWEPGETARLQVRSPFARSTALVTVEREGILEASVRPLGRENPVLSIPIEGRLAPNAFVSVLAVRGRVSRPQPTARLDLGKPALRFGLTELEVGWDEHRLAVDVKPEHEVYRVREKASVNLVVRTPEGGPPPAGSHVALAAVDEGLLELAPNPTWNLLRAMMHTREESVATSTSGLQLIGKRHFGRKAVDAGGGGGRKPTRELLDTLLLWQARIPLDAQGDARVEIPLNDSLTSFRIVAVALGDERFGTGEATIRSTQDLMLFSGLAPLARSGDRLWSEVTARNTTERPMDVRLSATVQGLGETLSPQEARLGPGQAKTLGWETSIPNGVTELPWEIEATDAGSGDSDRLRIVQRVVPAVPVRTMQASLLRFEPPGPLRLPVERPADALPGRGEVRVALAASLSDGLSGVRDWMRAYPYTCLEQRVSRAIALGDEALWSSVVDGMPSSLDENGLLEFFPTMDSGSDLLTSYVLSISIASGRPLPADLEARLEEGLVAFVEGRVAQEDSGGTDLPLRKLSAIAALARAGVARPDLSSSITIEPSLWPMPALIDWWQILLQTADFPERKSRLAEVERLVRARLYLQGTTLTASAPDAGSPSWLLSGSGADTLRLILLLIDSGAWKEDLPRLVRGALGEQRRGAWSTTVANAWGVVALGRFSNELEAEAVSGTTTVSLGTETQELDWRKEPRGGTLDFAWPDARADLVTVHQGSGRPWITVQARAAIPLREPLSSGFTIRRTVTPVSPRPDGALHVGDVLRVRLDVEAASDSGWVVVDDPVPTGASHLASFPGGAAPGASDGLSPDFVERGFEAYRAYFSEVPQGAFSLEYAIRLNQAGELGLPPTRVEALYAPESFGETPNAPVRVER